MCPAALASAMRAYCVHSRPTPANCRVPLRPIPYSLYLAAQNQVHREAQRLAARRELEARPALGRCVDVMA
ncbi:MAG: hypothetical protein AABZ53_14750 [Planctomycetota bacterium]